MLQAKKIKELIRELPDDAMVFVESVIDADDCLWSPTTEAWVAVDEEGGNKPCLVLRPANIQISQDGNILSVVEGSLVYP